MYGQWISPSTEDASLLQFLVVTVTAVSSAAKASWVVMYTMNNHTYNAMRVLERYHRISYTLLIRTPLLFRQKMVIFVFYIRTRQNDSIVRTAKMQAR